MKHLITFILPIPILFSCGADPATHKEDEEDEYVSPYKAGKEVYDRTCVVCHQASGEGIPGTYPPLANSDYLRKNKNRAIENVLFGADGEMVVNGETYNVIMPPQGLSDQETMDVINYIFNSWGNDLGEVTLEDVALIREGR